MNKECFYITYAYGKNETESHFRFDESTKSFKISYRTVKEFDTRKNLVKETYYDDEDKPYRIVNKTYNDKNQLIRETRNDDYQDADEISTYNEKGDIMQLRGKNSEIIYTYKYDEYGNWIEKMEKNIITEKGKSEISDNHLIKRTIEYYNF